MSRPVLLVFLSFALSVSARPYQTEASAPMIVSTEWVQAHLTDPDVVILHVAGNRRDYMNGHIPGARFLWDGWLATSNPDLTYELPSVADLDSTLEFLGVSNTSRVVLYFTGGRLTVTARMYLTFDYLGMGSRTSIMDGGLELWKSEGKGVSKEIPVVRRSSFTPNLKPSVVISGEDVRKMLANPQVSLVDARSPRFYQGDGGGMPRPGHIPGAVNIPYSVVVDSLNKFKDPDVLKGLFAASNIPRGNKIVAYCHIGQQASLLYFIARAVGYEASMYDGSFEDWSGREDTPVRNPSEN